MPYRFGRSVINGYQFFGRSLDGRKHGEQIVLPLEGQQGASESYLVPEAFFAPGLNPDGQSLIQIVLGTEFDGGNGDVNIATARHYLFSELEATEVQLTPYTIGSEQLSALFADDPEVAALIALGTYPIWKATIKYAETRGWEVKWRGSVRTASVDVAVPASGPGAAYTKKDIVPFPEANLSISNNRVPSSKFHALDVLKNYGGRVNASAVTLPNTGEVVEAETMLFQTFTAEHHAVRYGLRYYTVSYEFLVQDISWNKLRHRHNGALVAAQRADGSPLFQTADFSKLFV